MQIIICKDITCHLNISQFLHSKHSINSNEEKATFNSINGGGEISILSTTGLHPSKICKFQNIIRCKINSVKFSFQITLKKKILTFCWWKKHLHSYCLVPWSYPICHMFPYLNTDKCLGIEHIHTTALPTGKSK